MLNTSIMVGSTNGYFKAWNDLLLSNKLSDLTKELTATTFSWKVENKTELFNILQYNADNIDQVHVGTVNGRYIASAVLRISLESNINILKILERRHDSHDPLGLDSVDFLTKDIESLFNIMTNAGLAVEKESNEMHSWLSVRFGMDKKFEAKFTDHLVLHVAIKEMLQAEEMLLADIDNTDL